MILRIYNHSYHYEAENLCRVFFPYEKINVVKTSTGESDIEVVTLLNKTETKISVYAEIKTAETFFDCSKDIPLDEIDEDLDGFCERISLRRKNVPDAS